MYELVTTHHSIFDKWQIKIIFVDYNSMQGKIKSSFKSLFITVVTSINADQKWPLSKVLRMQYFVLWSCWWKNVRLLFLDL